MNDLTTPKKRKCRFRPEKRKGNTGLKAIATLLAFMAVLLSPVRVSAKDKPAMDSRQVKAYITSQVARYAHSVGSHKYRVDVHPFPELSPCSGPLNKELSNPEQPVGRLTLTLSCETPYHWKARIKAKVSVMVNMVVASKPLRRDQQITPGDLSLKATDITYVRHGYFTSMSRLSGKAVKRNVQAGHILTPRQVEMPEWVKKDNEVIIEARRDTMVAQMKGLALESGTQGDTIRVRNLSSQKEILATVTGRNKVSTLF
ncbi:flagellar basal body P-ring formation chaperone FlgA [Parasalinivibrio latis]|uniref:flagellar basal body P-ring formation chaperone FlgA n=1 Tax=Parasalinivibrio latis TaxID=2952610 RepID=UPI0030E10EAC